MCDEGDVMERGATRETKQGSPNRSCAEKGGRKDSVTRRRGQRSYCMPDARQFTRINASSSPVALAGTPTMPRLHTNQIKEEIRKERLTALTKLSACSALTAETIASASTATLSSSVSTRTCTMRADCDVSCAKRSSKRKVAVLKSGMMPGAGGGWPSGGEWTTVTRGRGWEKATEVGVQ